MSLFKKVKNLFKRPPFAKAPEGKKVEPPGKKAPAVAKALAGKKSAVGGKRVKETYKILREPCISEKATQLSDQNKYTFKVYPNANKTQIAKAIASLYGVKVKSVNVINIKPKKRILRGVEGAKTGYKKAIITLEKGEQIEILPH